MAGNNHTTVTEFILSGLMDYPELQVPLFVAFLIIYFVTIMGNLGMVMLIRINSQLHTPMYFFLSNLSLVDFCYSSSITPKMLVNILSGRKVMPYAQCVAQFSFFATFVGSECFLLAAMAYDRYVAICSPLLYRVVMSRRVCILLVTVSYIGGVINSLVHKGSLLSLSFCGPNIINHFFCDIPPLLKLSCSDTHTSEFLLFTFSGIIAIFTILTIIISYLLILSAILQIHSTEGRHKVFSTCTSHLTAVSLLYGSLTFIYIQPSSRYSLEQEKVVSVFYTMVIPMLNPLIYSLRNKDVKDALRRTVYQKIFS
ncbi:olfactory receptor 5J3-like [Emydura macquarii macquarii]|uniref:olfactory receptor 5J3-like n=1 Tax=Emydura macquarii macquarii TaxID=1129001 RepID=UPI00352B2DB8